MLLFLDMNRHVTANSFVIIQNNTGIVESHYK